MLLFLDQEIDTHADRVEAECARRGTPYLRLCTERFPERVRLALHPAGGRLGGRILLADRQVDIDEITAVWFRRPGPVTLNPDIDEGSRAFAWSEATETLAGFYRALDDRRWVSPPHHLDSARHKIFQLQLAARLGLQVPHTLISNDPDEALRFCAACGGTMIYKPLRFAPILDAAGNEHGIYTTLIRGQDLDSRLAAIGLAPCLFQELIAKRIELRINVIGERVWTAASYSQETEKARLDFRLDIAGCTHVPFYLPPQLETACREMAAFLGLRMCNIDMIVTPNGRYVFLELNPNGQWAWIEDRTGLPLAAALIDELTGTDTLGGHPYLERLPAAAESPVGGVR